MSIVPSKSLETNSLRLSQYWDPFMGMRLVNGQMFFTRFFTMFFTRLCTPKDLCHKKSFNQKLQCLSVSSWHAKWFRLWTSKWSRSSERHWIEYKNGLQKALERIPNSNARKSRGDIAKAPVDSTVDCLRITAKLVELVKLVELNWTDDYTT